MHQLPRAKMAQLLDLILRNLSEIVFNRHRIHHLHKPGKGVGEGAIKIKNDQFVLH
jgi:hypothetical protein